MVEQPRPKPEMKLLSPASPLANRRNSSPQPQSITQGRAGRRKGRERGKRKGKWVYMFLMRDEKEERKKQARSDKQTRQHLNVGCCQLRYSYDIHVVTQMCYLLNRKVLVK